MRGLAADSLAGGKVLVIGASSQVGWFLLPRLLAGGCDVYALSRDGAPPGYPELDGLEWIDPARARESVAGYSHLASAGPLAVALDYARAMPALQAISATSTSSVVSKARSPDTREQDTVESIREAEEGLRVLARERHLPLLILRPTLVYGCGRDRNLSLLAGFIRRFGFLPLSTRAGGMRQPIHADDVAGALAAGLLPRGRRELLSPLCGGDTLDYRGMVRRVFAAVDRKPRLVALPPALLAGAVSVAERLRVSGAGNAQMVRRQAVNLVFDDHEARDILGVTPRRFHPTEADFHLPSPQLLERLSQGH